MILDERLVRSSAEFRNWASKAHTPLGFREHQVGIESWFGWEPLLRSLDKRVARARSANSAEPATDFQSAACASWP